MVGSESLLARGIHMHRQSLRDENNINDSCGSVATPFPRMCKWMVYNACCGDISVVLSLFSVLCHSTTLPIDNYYCTTLNYSIRILFYCYQYRPWPQ